MPKSKNQKQKILYIMKFFYEETDEEHTLTVNEIIAKLERNGISAARRSIYDDIRTLQAFGVDIVMRKSKTSEYFLGSRIFEMAELKILIDSVQSSRFVTKKKSESLIKKLKSSPIFSAHQNVAFCQKTKHFFHRLHTMSGIQNTGIYHIFFI